MSSLGYFLVQAVKQFELIYIINIWYIKTYLEPLKCDSDRGFLLDAGPDLFFLFFADARNCAFRRPGRSSSCSSAFFHYRHQGLVPKYTTRNV